MINMPRFSITGTCTQCRVEFSYNPQQKTGKYCSCRCSQRHRSTEAIRLGTAGPDLVKRYLIKTFGAKCSLCGWNKVHPKTKRVPVQLEHRDGNSDNNNLNNCCLLCPNCHSLTPTFGALNKGNGSSRRKKYVKAYRKKKEMQL